MTISQSILICFATNLSAATFWVATNGNDANPGTPLAPFATVQRGVTAAKAGDTVLVRDGTYGPAGSSNTSFAVNINSAGTQAAPITIQAENKGGAILDCQNVCYGYFSGQAQSAWFIIDGFDIKQGYSSAIHCNSGGCKNIVIRNNHIHHIGNRICNDPWGLVGIYADSGATGVIEYNKFWHIGRTNDSGNSFDHAIYTHANFNIQYNVFYDFPSGWAIQTAQGFQGSISYNTFYGQNQYPGKYGQIMLWETAGGPLSITRNIFANPGGAPIVSYQATVPNCTLDANFTTAASMSDYSGCRSTNGVLNSNPKFVNPPVDYHLQTGSPAIGYGAMPVPVGPAPCKKVITGPGGVPMTITWSEAVCPP